MQLRTARLCLDCEEVHDAQQCPICASEAFAFLSRWVPAPERRTRARPRQENSDVSVYRQLLTNEQKQPTAVRLLKQGAIGFAALSLLRYAWRRAGESKNDAVGSRQ
jgi:hypothetical protein